MSKVRFIQYFLMAALATAVGAVPAWSQKKPEGTPSKDPNDNVRKVKPEVKEAFS